jgi:radical SAM superfamily enzyme YgiQ (UPF0313 family)
MKNSISILLINPWISDFAAYNLWAEPLGILYIASILKKAGARLSYINTLASTEAPNPRQKDNGCSKYNRHVVRKPECLSFIERNYAYYGITADEFIRRIRSSEKPDIVLVTSAMTYWYPGVFKTIKILKNTLEAGTPLILGGIYAKLCPDHAKTLSDADYVYNDDSPVDLMRMIEQITGKQFNADRAIVQALSNFKDYPPPLHEIHKNSGFFSVLTRMGCPFSCSYCASGILCRGFSERPVSSVVSEIINYSELTGVKNIAFYDDALLIDPDRHIIPILEKIIDHGKKLFFHLPNGIHSRLMTKKIARLFYSAGIKTIRIGLETADKNLQYKFGNKTSNSDYTRSVDLLRESGYAKKDIGTYIMAGLPSQSVKNVEASLDFVDSAGSSPYLAYFSPIPGTKIWPEAVALTPFPIDREPLFHNNTVFIMGNKEFSGSALKDLNDKALGLRGAK